MLDLSNLAIVPIKIYFVLTHSLLQSFDLSMKIIVLISLQAKLESITLYIQFLIVYLCSVFLDFYFSFFIYLFMHLSCSFSINLFIPN